MRQSQLQRKILLNLPEENVTRLAKSVGSYRSSVSRCLYYMQSLGLVFQDCEWQLTEDGKERLSEINRFELARDLSWQWSESSACFDCPCGVSEIILSDNGDEKTCDCGRVYRLIFRVEVKCGPK